MQNIHLCLLVIIAVESSLLWYFSWFSWCPFFKLQSDLNSLGSHNRCGWSLHLWTEYNHRYHGALRKILNFTTIVSTIFTVTLISFCTAECCMCKSVFCLYMWPQSDAGMMFFISPIQKLKSSEIKKLMFGCKLTTQFHEFSITPY